MYVSTMNGANEPKEYSSNMGINSLPSEEVRLFRSTLHRTIEENIDGIVHDLLLKEGGRSLLRHLLHRAVDTGLLHDFRSMDYSENTVLQPRQHNDGNVYSNDVSHPRAEPMHCTTRRPLLWECSSGRSEARDKCQPLQCGGRLYTNAVLQNGRVVEFIYEDTEQGGESQKKVHQTTLCTLGFPNAAPMPGNRRRIKG